MNRWTQFALMLITVTSGLTVPAALPLLETLPPFNVSSNEAIVRGSILLNRPSAYVAFQVRPAGARRWVSRTRWQRIVRMETFAPGQEFFATVTKLSPKTDYEVRAIALVAAVRRNGDPVAFHTLPDATPMAAPESPDQIDAANPLSARATEQRGLSRPQGPALDFESHERR